LGWCIGCIGEQEHGLGKIYHIQPDRMFTDSNTVVYMVRPHLSHMEAIASNIRADQAAGVNKQYHLLFVPRRTMICERFLESAGVYGSLEYAEYELDWIPIDDDTITLQLDLCFRECFLVCRGWLVGWLLCVACLTSVLSLANRMVIIHRYTMLHAR
jgi:hypothetical protein